MNISISIIICTYNRAELLSILVDSITKLNVAREISHEVLIIDNNSVDLTKQISAKFLSEYGNSSYFIEQKQGLSNARNRGWQEAKGQYVAYIDDDCVLPQDWLMNASKIIKVHKPIAFGGSVHPYYISKKPNWYKDIYGSFLVSKSAQIIQPGTFNLCGGNFIVKRAALAALGGFDPSLGMSGNNLGYSEEDELQIRIRKYFPGEIIYFDPKLYVNHLVRPEKMQILWRIRHQYQRGKSLALMKKELGSRMSISQFVMRSGNLFLNFIFGNIKGLVVRDKKKYPYFFNWFYEVTSYDISKLGSLIIRWNVRLK